MTYFAEFTSNTYAGSGNQFWFSLPEGQVQTGRVFYKITAPGKYRYSLLFSNIMDSTYASGDQSCKNMLCHSWKIHSAKVGKGRILGGRKVTEMIMGEDVLAEEWQTITFDGRADKTVAPGEFFASDPVELAFAEGEYLCLEMTYSGKMIPYHEETLLPVFVKEAEGWKYGKQMPFAGMVGCDRPVKAKIAYWGDSITQGIGTAANSYLHWNAELSRKIGNDYAFWNLGIGYGRGNDAASNGAWAFKAKQNDVVFVCYGVNDILQGLPEAQVKADLTHIVAMLKQAGKKVVLQTVPPFGYEGEQLEIWHRVNGYIRTVLKEQVDLLFDNVSILGDETTSVTRFGGHPNEEGCKLWADALWEAVSVSQLLD